MNALRDSMLSAQGYREEWEIPLLFFMRTKDFSLLPPLGCKTIFMANENLSLSSVV